MACSLGHVMIDALLFVYLQMNGKRFQTLAGATVACVSITRHSSKRCCCTAASLNLFTPISTPSSATVRFVDCDSGLFTSMSPVGGAVEISD